MHHDIQIPAIVNRSTYMNFKKATDILFGRVGHETLAKELGVSVALIRQARLGVEAKAHRTAPEGWEKAVLKIAEKQARRYGKLAEGLRKGQ
jgi:hypothetical protein